VNGSNAVLVNFSQYLRLQISGVRLLIRLQESGHGYGGKELPAPLLEYLASSQERPIQLVVFVLCVTKQGLKAVYVPAMGIAFLHTLKNRLFHNKNNNDSVNFFLLSSFIMYS
jgi:hypothetical protein